MPLRSTQAVALVVFAVGLAGCGGGSGPITQPTPVTTTTTTQPPKPTGIVLPAGMVCDPTPPPLFRYVVKVWSGSCKPGEGCLLDSHPVVQNVDDYCGRAGFGSSWKFCETRLEGNPQRQACDYLLVGQAKDTLRWGPTWYGENRPCGTDLSNCSNHPSEQFKVHVKGPGEFMACVDEKVPLSPEAELGGPNGRCGIINIE